MKLIDIFDDKSLIVRANYGKFTPYSTITKNHYRNNFTAKQDQDIYKLVKFCVYIPKYNSILYSQVDESQIKQLILINFSDRSLISHNNIYWFITYLQTHYFLNGFHNIYDVYDMLKVVNIRDIITDPYSFISHYFTSSKSTELSITNEINDHVYNLTVSMSHDIFDYTLNKGERDRVDIKSTVKNQLGKVLKINNKFQDLLNLARSTDIRHIFQTISMFNFTNVVDINAGINFLNNSNPKSTIDENIFNKFCSFMKFLDNINYNYVAKNMDIKINFQDIGVSFIYNQNLILSTMYKERVVCHFIIMGCIFPIDHPESVRPNL